MAPPAPSDWADRLSDAVREHESTRRARRPALARYEIGELLGRGGMGLVYRAFDTHLGRDVALKVLSDAAAGDPEAQARFLREAQLAARLRHPHITQVYDAGEHEGRVYIALELVPGGSLKDARPALREAVLALRDAARAVHYAHEQGVIHRDLKPANLLLDRGGRVFVTDFGLARRSDAAGTLTLSGTVMGTPVYMSPEQARGHTLDPRSDVYSLGATAYEILSGRPPFEGPNELQILKAVCLDEPPPPRRHAPSMPADLEAVVLKAMDKAPSGRYASAAELADDLERWLEGLPVRARTRGTFYRVRKKLVRHRWRVLAGTSSALLAGAVALFILSRPDPWERAFDRRLASDDFSGAGRLLDDLAAADPKHADLDRMRRRLEEKRDGALRSAFEGLGWSLVAEAPEGPERALEALGRIEGDPHGPETRRARGLAEDFRAFRARIAHLEQDVEAALKERRWDAAGAGLDELGSLRPPESWPGPVLKWTVERIGSSARTRARALAAGLSESIERSLLGDRDAYPDTLLKTLARVDPAAHAQAVKGMDELRALRHEAEDARGTAELAAILARMEAGRPGSLLTAEIAGRWARRLQQEWVLLDATPRRTRIREAVVLALRSRSCAGLYALGAVAEPEHRSWIVGLGEWLQAAVVALAAGDPAPVLARAPADPAFAEASETLLRDLVSRDRLLKARSAAARVREACLRRDVDAAAADAGALPDFSDDDILDARRSFERLEAEARAAEAELGRLGASVPGGDPQVLQSALERTTASMPSSRTLREAADILSVRIEFAWALRALEGAGSVTAFGKALAEALSPRFRSVPERPRLAAILLRFADERTSPEGALDVERLLDRGISAGLDDPRLLHRRGSARWRLGLKDKAWEDWGLALKKTDGPSVERAILRRRLGQLAAAEADARACLDADPAARALLGQVLYLKHVQAPLPLSAEALKDLEESERRLAGLEGGAACWRGMAAWRLGKADAARDAYLEARKAGRVDASLRLAFLPLSPSAKVPDESRIYADEALAGADRLSEDEVVALGIEAAELPWSAAARLVRRDACSLKAYCLANRDYRACLEEADRALQIDRKAWLALLARGTTRIQFGPRALGLQDLRDAHRLAPDPWRPALQAVIGEHDK